MKLIRWIVFLPAALGGAMVVRILWGLLNIHLIHHYLGDIAGGTFRGIGEVIGVLIFLYTAIRLAPSNKKMVGCAICLLGMVFGLLIAVYLVFLLVKTGLKSEDTRFLRYIGEDLARCLIETVTLVIFFLELRRGRPRGWLKGEPG